MTIMIFFVCVWITTLKFDQYSLNPEQIIFMIIFSESNTSTLLLTFLYGNMLLKIHKSCVISL